MKRAQKRGKAAVTRQDVVDAANKLIVQHNNLRPGPILVPLIRYKAWQRAVSVARHNRLFPPEVLKAVAKHGVYDPDQSEQAAEQKAAA